MNKLSVVFYWHMHQPFYRDAVSQEYILPWVYLHAMKDYTDMASIVKACPEAKVVFNFVPSLSIQIDHYAQAIDAWLHRNEAMPDPLLQLLAKEDAYTEVERAFLMSTCFRLNHERNMLGYPSYNRLWQMKEQVENHQASDYLDNLFFCDLVCWYHLGWMAQTLRDTHPLVSRLMKEGRDFSIRDRHALISLIGELMHDIPKNYRALVEGGQAEISTTPYAHPIMPLMLDFNTARETIADANIPAESYPDGEARAVDHIRLAQEVHAKNFGDEASGCWPAEGAVSQKTVELLSDAGFRWCATGEAVLHHSLKANIRATDVRQLYQPWRVADSETVCFFRDDNLSDLLGFEYSRWDTQHAVDNFMHELSLIRERTIDMKNPVVSIIMDGENAWEHYHENAVPFLTNLYQAIVDHDDYDMTTFSDYLDASQQVAPKLDHMVAGSWVYGNLSTWIGDQAKTRAWELLIDAKKALDSQLNSLDEVQSEAALEQLRICEGSDWCWWFGDYNAGDVVRDFDQLYRRHLSKIYEIIGLDIPQELQQTISEGNEDASADGTMRKNS
ncbi:MAG: glycoside hydrolase family 57 protein [Mariprofundaceae bacterium]|nr:glycoside hydrolase family 57 protein [Mariprofundaceae bacterium]